MTLGLCAIVKDEGPFLAEWCEHYYAQGVDQITLYDNGSTDDTLAVAQKLGIPVLDWPGPAMQMQAYTHKVAVAHEDWIIFADLDEFIWHPGGKTIRVICEEQPFGIDGIFAPWRGFGFGGHQTRPPGGVIENYLWRGPDDHCMHSPWWAGKSIVRPREVYGIPNPHEFDLRGHCIQDSGLVCNHYYTRSVEDARLKWQKGRADNGTTRPWHEEFEVWGAELSTVFDPGLFLQTWQRRLRDRMERTDGENQAR